MFLSQDDSGWPVPFSAVGMTMDPITHQGLISMTLAMTLTSQMVHFVTITPSTTITA